MRDLSAAKTRNSQLATRNSLRVALLAGTLGQGGAEKQLVYMARALRSAGVDIRVYSLTRGEFYEPVLRAAGIEVVWVGRLANPLLRMVALAAALRRFRPDVLQATHFFTNLYVAIVGRLLGITAIGSIRSNIYLELETSGRWGRLLLNLPRALLANSYIARENAAKLGFDASKIYVLPNVIDLQTAEYRVPSNERSGTENSPLATRHSPLAVAVGSLLPEKRLDRFLMALAKARKEVGTLQGALIGDGRERAKLEAMANDLGLLPDGVTFMGRRNDVAARLTQQATMLVLTSDHEGFPNVLLEAMATCLPVITTPAGDAGVVVQDGVTGYVVPFDDVDKMAELMVCLAQSPDLSRQLGEAGRKRAAECYSIEGLGERLLKVYTEIGRRDA